MVKKKVWPLAMIVPALLAACAGSPQTARAGGDADPSRAVAGSSTIQRDKVTIDYRGAGLGGQVPEWVLWAAEGDSGNLLAGLPRLYGGDQQKRRYKISLFHTLLLQKLIFIISPGRTILFYGLPPPGCIIPVTCFCFCCPSKQRQK
jgi:hypothetical protein